MKQISSIVLLLLGVADCHKLNQHQSHYFSVGIPIGERLLQINSHALKWSDEDVKAMNAETYLDDVRDTMNEQIVEKQTSERPDSQDQSIELHQKHTMSGPRFAPKKADPKVQLQEMTQKQNDDQESNVTDESGGIRRGSAMQFDLSDEPNQDAEQQQTVAITNARVQKARKERDHASQVLAQQAKEKLDSEVKEMKDVWHEFGETLDLSQREKALSLHAKLEKEGHHVMPLKVDTKHIYEQQFFFKDVAGHENVQNMLKDLDVAQGDFNQNPSNPSLMRKFISAAQTAAKDLKKEYGEFWHTPGYKASGWSKGLPADEE